MYGFLTLFHPAFFSLVSGRPSFEPMAVPSLLICGLDADEFQEVFAGGFLVFFFFFLIAQFFSGCNFDCSGTVTF